jgi:cysteine-S-conjugate beta-lyase
VEANPFSYKWTMYPGRLPLNFGDMDFATDPEILAAVSQRLAWPLVYAQPASVSGATASISKYYLSRYGLRVPDEAFWLGSGCLAQSFHVFSSLCGEGDEVLFWSPAFKYIRSAIEHCGAKPVPVDISAGIHRDSLEAGITSATRAIYLVNPHNPTGHVYSRDELHTVLEVAERHGLLVVSNELHSRLVLDGEHIPFASLGEAAAQSSITLSGASKSHNLAALGGSFAFTHNHELLAKIRAASAHVCPEANGLQQTALIAAYAQDGPWILETRERIRRSRDTFIDQLREGLPKLRISRPSATYFLWVEFQPYLRSGESAADALEQRCGIVAAPGDSFGASASWARLSLSLCEEVLDQAARQIIDGLDSVAASSPYAPDRLEV